MTANHAHHKGKKGLALRSSSGALLLILLYAPLSITFYPVTANDNVWQNPTPIHDLKKKKATQKYNDSIGTFSS